jgi:C4-dicarboxylate-specific signal transduction histidine kinase
VFRDISEWVDSEEALRIAREELESQRQNIAHMERLNTTGAMAAGIAHEVNQPLTAISNYSRVAKRLLDGDDIPREQFTELLDKLDVQSQRASEVIQRMRSYVKKPSGALSEVDVNEMVREVIALAEVDSRINDVSVHFEPQANLPALKLDVVQIQQVALNLIRNAMEATAVANTTSQGVMVKTVRQGSMINIQVIDHGIGIAEGGEDQLFNPFYTTKTNGMGIGLSICQSIIQAQGGTIGFHRNPQGGATFYFSLPIA